MHLIHDVRSDSDLSLSMDPFFSIKNLKTCFGNGDSSAVAVNDVSFEIDRSETFALVGESGSGKSVTALSALRLLPANGRILQGEVLLDGDNLFDFPESRMCDVRGKRIGMIFQDPMTSLNPVMTIGSQVAESLSLHTDLTGADAQRRVLELMNQVEIPDAERRISEFPHQLSGGQRQRVVIAIALASKPELLIADEPTTALDVTIQAQILKLLADIQKSNHMALWLITHDLGIVDEIADKVAVMRYGEIVEQASRDIFFTAPRHAYSRQLFEVLPSMDHPRSGAEASDNPVLDVRDFKVYYPIRKGLFKRTIGYVKAVDKVSFALQRGKTLALVGESGCGKTTLGKGLLHLIPNSGGSVHFEGESLSDLSEAQFRKIRADMQLIFQDPFSSMNPRMLVGEIIQEGIRSLRAEYNEDERRERIVALLEQVGLSPDARLRYPHEFSGGQRQRICIARALAVKPRLIVCDEPTSALDVSVQAQIIGLLKDLQQNDDISYLFISHDLGVVAEMADNVAVMQHGRIIEIGSAKRILQSPEHAYTAKLIDAVPKLNSGHCLRPR